MIARWWMIACIFFGACLGRSPDEEPQASPKEPPIAAPAKPTPAAPDCARLRDAFEREVSSAYVAKHRYRNYATAIEMAPAVPAACRGGWWHLAVARLLDLGLDRALVGFEHPEAALAAALQQPYEVDVLERVAEVAELHRTIQLPADACPRAHAAARRQRQASATDGDRVAAARAHDGARYVCAHVALTDGDGTAATIALDEIAAPDRFADFELARARAADLTRDRAARRRYAKLAIAKAKRSGHYTRVTEVDRDAIVRLATQLSR